MSATSLPPSILARCADPARGVFLHGKLLARAAKAMHRGATRFDAVLLPALESVPDAERALLHLDRHVEAAFSPSGILEEFEAQPHLLELFFRLVLSSEFLADIFVRDPELLRWLATSGVLARRKSRGEMLAETADAVQRFLGPEKRLRALKRYQRRELLRIAARDILHAPPLDDTVTELSWLADGVTGAALREATARVEERAGCAIGTPLCILALGKWGGEELNYSSDIDFMVVYGEHREAGRSSTQELVVKVTELLVRYLTDPVPEGALYRCDLRLRPDGAAGATALSLAATLSYYEARGALWERQMLIKARPAAGDETFGAAVLERLRPFVYPRALAVPPSRLVQDIRGRLALRWNEADDVKHGRGGIRDIEFSVQALQQLHGGADANVRMQGTLAAMHGLSERGALSEDERARFSAAYRFLRRTEHMLQLRAFEQTHALPATPGERDALAYAMDTASWDVFAARLDAARDAVREISDTLLSYSAEDGADATALPTVATLEALGFHSAAETMTAVHSLVEGQAGRAHGQRLRETMERHIGVILRDASSEALPDACVRALQQFLDRSRAGEEAGAFLADARTRPLLLRLASLAPALLRALAAEPLALEAVLTGRTSDALGGDDLRIAKLAGETEAATRLLLHGGHMRSYARALSDIADTAVSRAHARALTAGGDAPFAVAALGKYGARELSSGSDLDVLFLYREEEGWTGVDAQSAARGFIETMHAGFGSLPLYTVDARLRPEGKSSPLATSFEAYARYLESRASLWEVQSLLRLRVVAGRADLAADIAALVASTLSAFRLRSDHVAEIDAMRRRMEPANRFRSEDFFDVKLSAGGLVDVEFAVQLLALQSPDALRGCGGNTFALLQDPRASTPALAPQLARLAVAYDRLRRMQLSFRLLLDSPSNMFPSDERQQAVLAAAAGHGSARMFLEELRAGAGVVRSDYEAVVRYARDTVQDIP